MSRSSLQYRQGAVAIPCICRYAATAQCTGCLTTADEQHASHAGPQLCIICEPQLLALYCVMLLLVDCRLSCCAKWLALYRNMLKHAAKCSAGLLDKLMQLLPFCQGGSMHCIIPQLQACMAPLYNTAEPTRPYRMSAVES